MAEHQEQDLKAKNIKGNQDAILHAFRQTERYSVIAFVALMVLLAGGIVAGVVLNHDAQVQSLLISTAVSLLVSLIFTLFYTFIVERARSQSDSRARSLEIQGLKDTVSETIDVSTSRITDYVGQRIKKLLDEETTRLVDKWPELLPANYFPEAGESNKQFLDELRRSVANAQRYMFRGSTARFVAGLLDKHATPNLDCQILIIDPREPNAIRVHALDRYAINDDRDQSTIEHYEEMERDEIYTAIVGLFALRHRFRIELRTCADTLFYRSEIVDGGMFVSFYKSDRKVTHPPTYYYKKGTVYYEAFRNDFQQSWNFAKESFPMTPNTTQEKLREFLIKLGFSETEIDRRLVEWRAKAEEFKAQAKL